MRKILKSSLRLSTNSRVFIENFPIFSPVSLIWNCKTKSTKISANLFSHHRSRKSSTPKLKVISWKLVNARILKKLRMSVFFCECRIELKGNRKVYWVYFSSRFSFRVQFLLHSSQPLCLAFLEKYFTRIVKVWHKNSMEWNEQKFLYRLQHIFAPSGIIHRFSVDVRMLIQFAIDWNYKWCSHADNDEATHRQSFYRWLLTVHCPLALVSHARSNFVSEFRSLIADDLHHMPSSFTLCHLGPHRLCSASFWPKIQHKFCAKSSTHFSEAPANSNNNRTNKNEWRIWLSRMI